MRTLHHSITPTLTTLRLGMAIVLSGLAFGGCDPGDVDPQDEELLLAEDDDSDEEELVDPASVPQPLADDPQPVVERPDFDLTAAPDVQGYVWKNWVSEEQPASTCATGQLVSGYSCSGGNCDNQRLECHDYGGVLGDRTWSNWFSEEAPNNFYQCPGQAYVMGVTCSGSSCDNLSVECTTTTLAKTNCQWFGPYSEEAPSTYLTGGTQAIAGIWCTGSNCDNHYYWVCNT